MSSPALDGVTLGVAPVAALEVRTDDILSSVNGPPDHSVMTTRPPQLSAALGVQVTACLTPAWGFGALPEDELSCRPPRWSHRARSTCRFWCQRWCPLLRSWVKDLHQREQHVGTGGDVLRTGDGDGSGGPHFPLMRFEPATSATLAGVPTEIVTTRDTYPRYCWPPPKRRSVFAMTPGGERRFAPRWDWNSVTVEPAVWVHE